MKKLIYILFLFPLSVSAFPPVTHGIIASQISQCDADAQRYIDSAGLTNATEKTAICNCVKQLKDSSVWTKIKAFYPYLGGTASTTKWNAKNPVNADTAFRITWNGGMSYGSYGVKGNGSNSYGNTHFQSTNFISNNNSGFGLYFSSNIDEGASDFGALNPSFRGFSLSTRISNTLYGASATGFATVANTDSRGLYILSRQSSTSATLYKNNSSILSLGTTSLETYGELYICGRSLNGTMQFPDTKQIGLTFISDGLTATEVRRLHNIFTTFLTAIGR